MWALAAFLSLYVGFKISLRLAGRYELPTRLAGFVRSRGCYILLGILFGVLLPETWLSFLNFSLCFMLSWFAFSFGASLEIRSVRKLSRGAFGFGMLLGAMIIALVFSMCFVILLISDVPFRSSLAISAALAIFSSVIHVPHSFPETAGPSPGKSVLIAKGLSDIVLPARIVAVFAFILFVEIYGLGAAPTGLLASVGLGAALGTCLSFLSRDPARTTDSMYVLVSLIGLGGGISYAVGLSPVITGVTSGFWAVNSTSRRLPLVNAVSYLQRFSEIAIAFLIGTGLRWNSLWDSPGYLVSLSVSFTALRILSSLLSSYMAGRLFAGEIISRVPTAGAGFLGLPGLALALIYRAQGWTGDAVVAIATLNVMFEVTLSSYFSKRFFLKSLMRSPGDLVRAREEGV